jgi:hypothetical protein
MRAITVTRVPNKKGESIETMNVRVQIHDSGELDVDKVVTFHGNANLAVFHGMQELAKVLNGIESAR